MVLISLCASDGRVAWRGEHTGIPEPQNLVMQLLSCDDEDIGLLASTVIALLQHAPANMVAKYLDWLLCMYWRETEEKGEVSSMPNPARLAMLGNVNAQRQCGYVFNKGDIAWNCRQCQKDPTCVLCDECFRKSNHAGHDVTFHKTGPGGCCDCGDLEAWEEAGCCTIHSGIVNDELSNPIDRLPTALQKSGPVVISVVLDFLASCAVQSMKGYEKPDFHELFTSPDWDNKEAFLRLHNDDIHTYADVMHALQNETLQMTQQQALPMTHEVDEKGQALIPCSDNQQIRDRFVCLQNLSLLVSCQDKNHLESETRAFSATEWLAKICKKSDGLCRIAADALVAKEAKNSQKMSGFKPKEGWNSDFIKLQEVRDLVSGDWKICSTDDGFEPLQSSKLLLLVLLDALYVKELRGAVHGLYMSLLVDIMFKKEFSLVFTSAYSFLNRLFFRGIGTLDDSIFSFSVQIFTTASLVTGLCEKPTDLLGMLLESLLEAINVANETGGDDFLDSNVCVHRRFAHTFRDLEYVFQAGPVAIDLLCEKSISSDEKGDGEPMMEYSPYMDRWFHLLYQLQCMDEMTRAIGQHVQFESNRWMAAFGLALSTSSLGEVILEAAMKARPVWGEQSIQGPRKITRAEAALTLGRCAMEKLQEWLGQCAGKYLFKEAPALTSTSPPPPLLHTNRVDFLVHSGSVSFHPTLQRFIASAWMTACQEGLNLTIPTLQPQPSLALGLTEHPLRALVLHSQVMVGMWRRNGGSTESQALNYANFPLVKHLRDLDLVSIQLGVTLLGRERFMTVFFNRYNLERWLLEDDFQPFNDPSLIPAEYCRPMAEECLAKLIIIITETPKPAGEVSTLNELRREMVHKLMAAVSPHSEATTVSSLVNLQNLHSDAVENTLRSISYIKPGSSPALFDLKDELCLEYDPTFFHLARQDHQSAMERVLEKKKAIKPRLCGPMPAAPPLPEAHSQFQCVRELLYSPVIFAILSNIFSNALKNKSMKGKSSELLASRAVHILTLQIHALKQDPGLVVAVLGSRMSFFEQLKGHTSFREVARGTMQSTLLELMVNVFRKEGVLGPLYHEGLAWILGEIARMDEACSQILHGLGFFGQNVEEKVELKEGAEERKKRAQKKAMEAMMKRQAAFAQHVMDMDDPDMENDQSTESLTAETGVSECIMCHERTGAVMGYISFCQPSSLLSEAAKRSFGSPQDWPTHVVVGKTGCQVRSDVGLDSAQVTHLETGQQIVVQKQHGRRVKITSPVFGWCSLRSAEGYVILKPWTEWAFMKWGRARPAVTSCGHAVHLDCWDTYFAAMLQRSEVNQLFDGRHTVDVQKAEFLCPLCKSISNVLIPHTPTHMQTWRKVDPEACKMAEEQWNTFVEWLAGSSTDLSSFVATASAEMNKTLYQPIRRLMEGIQVSCGGGIGAFKNGSVLRHFQLLWTSLSGMLCHSELLSRCVDDSSNYSELTDVLDTRLGHQLFLSCEQALCLVSDMEVTLDEFTLRWQCLLDGRYVEYEQNDIEAKAAKFPLQAIFEESSKPANDRIKKIRRLLLGNIDSSNTSDPARRETHKCWDVSWPIFLQPVLTWDLSILAVAISTMSRSKEGVQNSIVLACLARLCQILLQPSLCLYGRTGEGKESDDIVGCALSQLRQRLAQMIGINISPQALQGIELVKVVYDAWIPFLRVMVLLTKVSGWFPEKEEALSEAFFAATVEELWTALSIPHIVKLLEDTLTLNLLDRWSIQYSKFCHSFGSNQDSSVNAGSKIDANAEGKKTENTNEGTMSSKLEDETLDDDSAKDEEQKEPSVHDESSGNVDFLDELLGPGLDSEDTKESDLDEALIDESLADYYTEAVDVSVASTEEKAAENNLDADSCLCSFMSSFTGSHTEPSIHGLRLHHPIADISHMSLVKSETVRLVELPANFTELYAQVKNAFWSWNVPDFDPALCLICGDVVAAGNHTNGPIGDCTLHSQACGCGIGIFFLVQKCTVLLIRNKKAAYYSSLYVDRYGEEDMGLKRGKPLFLSQSRYGALKEIYLKNQIAREVTKLRCAADRIIRDSYY